MDNDVCQVVLINSENVDMAASRMPDEEFQTQMAGTFRLLGDPTRLRVLLALNVVELCVCDLATLLETTSSAVSHQLRLLRTSGLVKFRRDGKTVYYSLARESTRRLLKDMSIVKRDEID
jgi:ArsR family transcriptional regulator, lead/cadmium/zinc/bismuth-responsive transcriptional repressor